MFYSVRSPRLISTPCDLASKAMHHPDFSHYRDAADNLPKYVFQCRFTWRCYEASKSSSDMIWLSFLFLGSIPNICFWTSISDMIDNIILGWWQIFILPDYLCQTRDRLADESISKNLEILADYLSYVVKLKRESVWEEVASAFNSSLYMNGCWKTPFCIFDGRICETTFRKKILEPLLNLETLRANAQLADPEKGRFYAALCA